MPGAVLLGGEAGVGKTRLIREFGAHAESAGARLLVGGCLELGADGLPFAPFTAVLRGLVREIGTDGVTALLPASAASGLARLLPEFGEPEPEAISGEAQARLFELVLILLERLAEQSQTVIEDTHWADRSTRDLLTFLIRNLGGAGALLVVVTYRSDELHRSHPLRRLLAEVERVERRELSRLPRREVAALVRGILDREPPVQLVQQVYTRSAGNPLFVEALLNCEDGDPAPRVAAGPAAGRRTAAARRDPGTPAHGERRRRPHRARAGLGRVRARRRRTHQDTKAGRGGQRAHRRG